tara:strand:+ start:27212 stop:28111 length:900 start_codon:yes stop_codon:yes gene_type:complete
VRLKTDEYCESLFADGTEVYAEDGDVFDLIAADHGDILLSEIPIGIQVQLCNRVIGSPRELCTRPTYAIFGNSADHGLFARITTHFFAPIEDSKDAVLRDYFDNAVTAGRLSLSPLQQANRVISLEDSVCDDMAYVSCTITIDDQSVLDAEAFAAEIDARIEGAYEPPSLFLCHASEDKPFVDRLARELDQRALFAWYDKREIFVGDSIVEKINDGLKSSDYLIAVLSPRSVVKPWVVREMSSSLMRQLDNKGIHILPVVVESCDIPPLFVDLKYADFRTSFDGGVRDLVAAIKRARAD